MGSRTVVGHILGVSASNIIKLLASVLVGFLLPKIVGITDYGYYKTFTLYMTYSGLFSIGITDGIYLKYGGKSFDDLDKRIFRFYSRVYFLIEFAFAAPFIASSLFLIREPLGFILLCFAVGMVSNNIIGYFQIVSQITSRFKELSIRNLIQSILTALSIICLYFSASYSQSQLSFKVYTIIFLAISLLLVFWYVVTYRKLVFGECSYSYKNGWRIIMSIIKMGAPLLVANLCSSLILTIDRQFVNIFFDTDTYAVYAFAYNMLSLITTALAAISTVIYPILKTTNNETLRNNYSPLLSIILVLVFGCIICFFPLSWFVPWFLPKYTDSLPIFRIILPGLAVSSGVTIIMHNYYKTDGKELSFFIKSSIILALSIAANFFAYYIFKSTISISIASIIVMLFWYLIVEAYFIKKYKTNWVKNLLYICLLSCCFYLITIWNNWWASMIIYASVFALTSVLFYRRELLYARSLVAKKSKKYPLSEKKPINKNDVVLVTGACGQLGYDVAHELVKNNYRVILCDVLDEIKDHHLEENSKYIKLDITNRDDVETVFFVEKPTIVIHCAAWTNVDGAEDLSNRQIVKKINVDGTDNLVKATKKVGAKFMYISTDYVFDGKGSKPWKPDDKDYAPLNYYGQTKLEGELSVSSQLENYFIVRIAWVFGSNGKNFIKTMLSLADKGHKELRIVDDQIGTPTYTYDLARLLVDMVQTDKYGYYHATNEGEFISWADFAEEIFRQAHKDVKVHRVSTEEYGISIAKRPRNSRLDKSKLIENGFKPLPDWKDAVRRYLEEIKEK